jgi:Family of unknown function (DUF5684)
MSTLRWIEVFCFLPPVVCAPYLFKRAGLPAWRAFVPILNFATLLELAGQSALLMLLYFVPVINLIAFFFWCRGLARAFGQSPGYAAGLALASPIFFPKLAFGPATYVAPTASKDSPASAEATEAAPQPAEPAKSGGGFLMKLVIAVPFAALVIWMRGNQEEDFKKKCHTDAVNWCAGRGGGCEQALSAHFDHCFEENHSSQRSGRYNRKYELDEEGLHRCIEQQISAAAGQGVSGDQTAPSAK